MVLGIPNSSQPFSSAEEVLPLELPFQIVTWIVTSNPGEAALGKIGVGGCLAPISNVSTPAADDPIPRFRDTSKEIAAICVEP